MPPTRLLTLVIASALFMEHLDSTVIATSLPAIAADLGVDPITLKLAFTAYYVALAVFIPISGWCADRYGARRVFRAAVALFTIASVGCAAASSLPELIGARFLQGMGGAMMVPVGRLVVLRVVPKHEMVAAMAWLSIPALFAPLMGPPLGGFITTYYHWRAIFGLNVPIGIVGFLLARRIVPQVFGETERPLDLRGFLLTGFGLSLVVFGFTLSSRAPGDVPIAAAMLGVGLLLVATYVAHARRVAHPIVDLSLLRIQTFRLAMLGGVLFRLSIGAIPLLLPLMLQIGFGLSPFASGSLTFAGAAGALTMKLTAAPILRRFGFRRVLRTNAVISAAMLAAIALFAADTPHWIVILVLLVGGFFRSLQFTSINALSYADVDRARMSSATSFVAVVQQLSLSGGVAVAALMLEASRSAAGRSDLHSEDFALGFVVIATLAAASALLFQRLAHDAGAEVSGHRPANPA
ncbi:MAG: MFS transporter [Burkholderiaceae bacterium]